MQLLEIRDILEAKVLSGEEHLNKEVDTAYSADLMSDVLASTGNQAILLTGLLNLQVIRTAEMMDICCVIIVRGKTPDAQLVKLAEEKDIVLMTTKYMMYASCGRLYNKGLFRSEDANL